MIKDQTGFRGEVHILVKSKLTGLVKHDVLIKNLVVNSGLSYVSQRMLENTVPVMSHMAIGTAGTAAAGAQSGLIAEAGSRVALVSATPVTTVVTNDSVQYIAMFEDGNPNALTAIMEAGLFNAATNGVMLARTTFPVINKDVDDTMTITWKIIQKALVA